MAHRVRDRITALASLNTLFRKHLDLGATIQVSMLRFAIHLPRNLPILKPNLD